MYTSTLVTEQILLAHLYIASYRTDLKHTVYRAEIKASAGQDAVAKFGPLTCYFNVLTTTKMLLGICKSYL